MSYENMEVEELQFLLEHPEEIETGCEKNCDACLDEAIREIKRCLKKQEIGNA